MCGIVGARHDWLVANGRDPAPAMAAAVAALGWRGPDGRGVVRVGDWWLGCARLAITQERSAQPVVRRTGRYAAVLNGAVTNARELWAALLPRAERRRAPPNDAWLPLLCVERGEPERLATLRGHHAYAVVDAATGELVLGQDRYGEKPFVALDVRDGARRRLVAFASTAPALQALGAPPLLPRARLGDWFRTGFRDWLPHRASARVRFDGLPRRGEPVVVAAGAALCGPRTPPAAAVSPRPATGTLRADLVAAVARCADTTVPAGLFLSGGVDSSCLAAALRATGRVLPAYQFAARGEPGAERAVARTVTARCGLSLRPVDGGPEVLDPLAALTHHAGLPLGDPSILAVHAVARAAAADGVRVMLSGEGADELFLGYRRHRALAALPHLPWLRAFTPRWSTSYFARWLRAAAAADPLRALLAVTPPAFGDLVLVPRLARRRCWRDEPPAGAAPVRRAARLAAAQRADLDGYLRCDLLPKLDVATMAAGVEGRCPWLEADRAAAPVRAALGKRQLREAFAADLPAAVFTQRKRGFALPLDRWFRGDLPWLDLLAEPRTRQREHLRPGAVAAAVDRHRAGRADLGHGLYLLVAAELFLRAAAR